MGTEQEIFDSALEGDDVDAGLPVEAEKPEPKAEQAAKTPPEGEKPEAAPVAAQDQVKPEPAPHQVPLSELLNTRERAQAAERERDDFRRRVQEFERQQAAAKATPKEPPDMFADPQGYHAHFERLVDDRMQGLQQQQEVMATQTALTLAGMQHGETFTKAWGEFQAQANTNPSLVADWEALPPQQRGSAVVEWYRRQTVLREVGSDPAAYKQKVLDDALNDEAFLAKVAERIQDRGAPQGSRPQSVVRLPSLNRQTSAATIAGGDDDDSEEAIFASATRRR